jgi:enoyl-CoA hydratase/carnithine racemase
MLAHCRAVPVLRIDDADRVRLLTFNRPEALNAFNNELWDALRDALVDAQSRDDIGCIVLTGEGRAFTAGQDLGEMAAPPASSDGSTTGYPAFIPVLESFELPLLAAVNGLGVGIGLTLLPYCDIVLMAEGARLRAPFVPLGVTTEAAGSVTLPARMGWQAAAHLLFTAEWLDAGAAVRAGLALRTVPPGELLDGGMTLARTIAAQPYDALRTTKRMLLAGRLDSWRAAREREDLEFARMVGSEENLAALTAFLGG